VVDPEEVEAEAEAEALSSEQDVVAPSSDDWSILGSGYVFYCFIWCSSRLLLFYFSLLSYYYYLQSLFRPIWLYSSSTYWIRSLELLCLLYHVRRRYFSPFVLHAFKHTVWHSYILRGWSQRRSASTSVFQLWLIDHRACTIRSPTILSMHTNLHKYLSNSYYDRHFSSLAANDCKHLNTKVTSLRVRWFRSNRFIVTRSQHMARLIHRLFLQRLVPESHLVLTIDRFCTCSSASSDVRRSYCFSISVAFLVLSFAIFVSTVLVVLFVLYWIHSLPLLCLYSYP
jgi:hypothetical protein